MTADSGNVLGMYKPSVSTITSIKLEEEASLQLMFTVMVYTCVANFMSLLSDFQNTNETIRGDISQ